MRKRNSGKRGHETPRRRERLDEHLPDPGREQINAWTRAIGQELVAASSWISEPNFTAIHRDDLAFLLDAYDRRFLKGFVRRRLAAEALVFRLSSRMTRTGGKTTRRPRADGGADYEIAISTEILFNGFADDDPRVSVAGIPCANRLEAPPSLPPPKPHPQAHHAGGAGRAARHPRRFPGCLLLPGEAPRGTGQPGHQARDSARRGPAGRTVFGRPTIPEVLRAARRAGAGDG